MFFMHCSSRLNAVISLFSSCVTVVGVTVAMLEEDCRRCSDFRFCLAPSSSVQAAAI